MSIEDFKPLTPEQLAEINKSYFEMEKREMEKKLNPEKGGATQSKEIKPLTPEQLAELNKEYFEMEKREMEKNKDKT